MNKKRFSQPECKGSPIQRQMALGLKLVYSFINFVIPLPATSLYIRHSQRNCKTAKTYCEANTEICYILQQTDCRSTAKVNDVFKLQLR